MANFTPKIAADKVILLSFFDGVGVAILAFFLLCGRPKRAYAWETDDECQRVTHQQFPWVHQRGDVTKESAQNLADDIRSCAPSEGAMILVAAGPPCPDFSKIIDKSDGRAGAEGSKFIVLCDFLQAPTELLPGFITAFGIENVVMNDENDTNYFSDRVGVQPVVLDGGDMQLVSRPRLRWLPIDWSSAQRRPLTGDDFQWTRYNKHRKIKLGFPPQRFDEMDTRGYKLHPEDPIS